jgi:integrase/recombinase XerC
MRNIGTNHLRGESHVMSNHTLTDIIVLQPTAHIAEPIKLRQLVAIFLSGKSPSTIEAYRRDLGHFAMFLGVGDSVEAAGRLFGATHGLANAVGLQYRAALIEVGHAPATINRKLAAVRALVTLARTVGLVSWQLEVPNVRCQPYRDTAGPGDDGVRRLLAAAEGQNDRRKAARDVALIRLMHDVALRRGEVCALDIDDVAVGGAKLAVVGKGQREKTFVSLPIATRQALAAWQNVRGDSTGPLFLSLDPSSKGPANGRLSGPGLWSIVKEIGLKAGLKSWPHGLRHSAITRALDVTGGNLRTAQKFSRHRDVRTLLLYDDNRTDLGGVVAELVAMQRPGSTQP